MSKHFKDSEGPVVGLDGVIDMLWGARQDIESSIKKDNLPNVVNLPSGATLTGEGADVYMESLRAFQKLLDVAVYHLERLPENRDAVAD